MTLRDDKQWLVHGEEPLTAGMKALNVIALVTTGNLLMGAPDVEMRAQGNVMYRWGLSQADSMSEGTELEQTAIRFAQDILDWMGGAMEEKPLEALDELHAVAFGFDSIVSGAGKKGDGWFRVLARGEHGG